MRARVIGIDLDNTIATYDGLFHRLALEHGLIDAEVPARKRSVRDAVRRREEGDLHWQRLQAVAYGARMPQAAVASGLGGFLARCGDAGATVYVISHRTEYARLDPDRVPLRHAAVDWMRAQGLFHPGFGLREDGVFFGATRAEKIACVGRLGCTHFIDDLEEVLLEPAFPDGVVKILYAPEPGWPAAGLDGIRVVAHWSDVNEVVFGRRG